MATCSRCGRKDEVHYGTDGLPYCSSCIFYGVNKQCWRCRMYLPATELQQYKGQWMCPYCLQDMRDEDRRASEYRHRDEPMRVLSYPETCERCGRDLKGRVYIWNGRRLCKNCLEEEQDKWGIVGGGPSGSPQKISLTVMRKGRLARLAEGFFSALLALFGIKRKQPVSEIVVYEGKMPIQYAKPMAERKMDEKDEESEPQIEGIMKKNKKSKAKRKGVSFPPAKTEKKQKESPFSSYKEKKKGKKPSA